jgi:DNA-binding CsgD family transcriptional regulator/PAS domain-containing protein
MSDQVFGTVASDLIGLIYDCALDPENWTSALTSFSDAVNGSIATLALADRRQGQIILAKDVGWSADQLADRTATVSDVLSFAANFADRHKDEPHTYSRNLTPEDWETQGYLRMLRSSGVGDVLTCFVIWTRDHFCGFGAGRATAQPDFDDREIALARLLLPHLRRAILISKLIDTTRIERDRMASALDALRCGVALTAENGKILHANRAAEQMIRARTPIQSTRGVLSAAKSSATDELHAAIRVAALSEAELGRIGLAVRLNQDDAPASIAHVLPLSGGREFYRLDTQAVAAVFIGTSHAQSGEAALMVAAAFRLTSRERSILEGVLAGRNVSETARQLHIGMTTAKTHLDSIFRKTGVNRQADLIKLALSVTPSTEGPQY